MSDFLQKIFGNQEVEDQPFPEAPLHTHDGDNSPLLAPSSIDSLQIKSGAVGTAALADESVNSNKIIDSAILSQHLDALSVTEQKLADAAVATAKIRNGAVNASKIIQTEAVVTLSAQIDTAIIIGAHIGTGVIQNAHLGNAIISSAKIVDGAIINAKIGDGQITSAKIGLAEVQNANIENLAVTNAKIANLAIDNAKIANVCADKITAGTINLTSTGYLATPYGGIRIGYLRQVNGVSTYGLQAGPGHGLMLDDGANGYARIWIDTSGNRPLVIDTTSNDRIFFKASSGNDILRLYGNNAIGGGFVDVLTSMRIGSDQPSDPVEGQMYWEKDPSGMGSGGRLMIYNGYSWHGVAWYDDI
jgi:hypothetical protein